MEKNGRILVGEGAYLHSVRVYGLFCYPRGEVANQSSGIADPISAIIAPILRFKPTWLQIQRQLGNGMQLSDTTAGRRIAQDLSGEIRK